MYKIPGVDTNDLIAWIESSIKNNENVLSSGYQGRVFLYQENNQALVVKTPPTFGLFKWLFQFMLKHEYRAYKVLGDIPGVAKCYGFLENQYLVLQFIAGQTLRQAELLNRDVYYSDLLVLIQALHAQGVAHTDLKRKDNVLVSVDAKPYIIDFGAAVVRKTGFAPLNGYLFSLAKRFDLNAWVKHKYIRAYKTLLEEDEQYYKPTVVESISRLIKRCYKPIKRLFVKSERL